MRRADALKKAEEALLHAENEYFNSNPDQREAWASIGYGWVALAAELGQMSSSSTLPPPPTGIRKLRDS